MAWQARNLFISHSWAYGDAYEKLCNLLDAPPGFSYRNCSVPKTSPVHNAANVRQLNDAMKERMQFAQVVVIMAGRFRRARIGGMGWARVPALLGSWGREGGWLELAHSATWWTLLTEHMR